LYPKCSLLWGLLVAQAWTAETVVEVEAVGVDKVALEKKIERVTVGCTEGL